MATTLRLNRFILDQQSSVFGVKNWVACGCGTDSEYGPVIPRDVVCCIGHFAAFANESKLRIIDPSVFAALPPDVIHMGMKLGLFSQMDARQVSLNSQDRLVGVELNPGPCDWPGKEINPTEQNRTIVRKFGKTYCPMCGQRVSRLRPGRPYYHEDKGVDKVQVAADLEAYVIRSDSTNCSDKVMSDVDDILLPEPSRRVPTPAFLKHSQPIEEAREINDLVAVAEVVEPNGEPPKSVIAGNVNVTDTKAISEMKLGKVTKGDRLVPDHLEQEGLCGFSIRAETLNPRAGIEYVVRNFTRSCAVDRRLPCHRGVELVKDKILLQEITVRTRRSWFSAFLLLPIIGAILAAMAVERYYVSLPQRPSTLLELCWVLLGLVMADLAIIMNLFRGLVASLLIHVAQHVAQMGIPVISPWVGYWLSLTLYRVPMCVVQLGVASVLTLVLFGVSSLAWWVSARVHKWLDVERVYIHVPVITSAMIVDNFGSNVDEMKLNLPTIFRRHIASVNVPSELVCAVQEGCIFVASMHIDMGLGFRLGADQAAL